jgi:hypothetical protein
MSTEKLCFICREHWPADTEFFNKKSAAADGLDSSCKACRREARAKTESAPPLPIRSDWESLFAI